MGLLNTYPNPIQKCKQLGRFLWCSDLVSKKETGDQIDAWMQNCWVVGDMENTLLSIANCFIYLYAPRTLSNGMAVSFKFTSSPTRVSVSNYNGQNLLTIHYYEEDQTED